MITEENRLKLQECVVGSSLLHTLLPQCVT